MKGVILAAGKGTRLYPVTRHIPKPLVPVAGKATILHGIERLVEAGILDVCVVVGESGDAIRDALGDEACGARLTYVTQTEPRGLAHAVRFARDFVAADPFCLYLGDAVYDCSLAPYRARFDESGCANLNLVKPVPDPERFGVAHVEGERITRLVEKPSQPDSNLAMAGVYFFREPIWDAIDALQPSARGEYEITDAIQLLVERGEDVIAGVYEGNWFDTGTLSSLLTCSGFLLSGGMRVGARSQVTGAIGRNVAIGADAMVRCAAIENSIVLEGARVDCEGVIRGCLIGGSVKATALTDVIVWNDESVTP
ncbi:MAG: sugar phosphate nucleotidyltransferase [Armatimonadota bacterium]